jgi:hypothetical protein
MLGMVVNYILSALGPKLIKILIDKVYEWIQRELEEKKSEPVTATDEVKKKPLRDRLQSSEDGPFRKID